MAYTFENLRMGLSSLCYRYPFVQCFSIGKSVMGKDLYCLRLGEGDYKIICVGAHHSLEWLTSAMLLTIADAFLNAYASGKPLNGYDVKSIFRKSSIYIVPMLNPDGIDLVSGRISETSLYYLNILKMTGGNVDIKKEWQANINGVDLNHNYDACWYEAMIKHKDDIMRPGPTRYPGKHPESEPESYAIAKFTRTILPRLVIAYHSQGEEIFYDFMGKFSKGAKQLAERFSELSGYRLSKPEGFSCFGGYKDWFIDKFDRPGFTIEIGKGKNPIGFDQLTDVVNKNIPILLTAADWTLR